MAAGPSWGDRQPHHVPAVQCYDSNGVDSALTTTSDASTAEALTIRDMDNVVEPPPTHLISRISTREWSLKQILETGQRFRPIPRLSSSSSKLTAKIYKSEWKGQPLIIEGFHKHPDWRRDEFRPEWLMVNGPKDISVRNVHDRSDKTISFAEFIAKSRASPRFTSPDEQERLYGKDAECPEEWNEWLRDSKVIPPSLTPHHAENLLSSRVETLMCYLGIGDTYTPCHKDLCASSGQNLMCYTEKGGSSFWFMTRSSDAPEASKYFQELKQELDHETHVITVEQLARAPFDVFVGEQQLGDLVLVPPRSCHQVVNNGGMTIKTSWSRMTLKGLETAYYHELPVYRRVCRTETYRVKFTIYHTLRQKTKGLRALRRRSIHHRSVLASSQSDNLIASTITLLKLFDDILTEEYSPANVDMYCLSSQSSFAPISSGASDTSSDHADGSDVHVTCDFCGADIFQSFFECLHCVATNASASHAVEHGDGFVVCAGCYVEGRSCRCAAMVPIQCRPFKELLSCRNEAAELLRANTPPAKLFPPLEHSALASGKGTFRAACLLLQIRKDQRDTKVCTLPKGADSTHRVPFSWGLTCKKCHSAKCFTHLLMLQKLHATDALLIHSLDASHEEHHGNHLTSRERFEDGFDSFLLSQKQATRPNFTLQRAYLALEYGTCKPINSQFMSLGWYDKNADILHTTSDQDEELVEDGTPMSPAPITVPQPPSFSPQPNYLPTTTRPPRPNSSAGVPTAPVPTERKRKRMLLDYIEMPAAAHRAKRQSRSTLNFIETAPFNASQESITSTQLVSDDAPTLPPSSSIAVAATQQERGTMQTDVNGSPTVTTENAITNMDPSMTGDATAIINLTANSPALSTSAITTTTTVTSGEPSNPIRRRKSRFSLAVPSLDSSALDTLNTGLKATTYSMSNVPASESINSTLRRQNNSSLHALSSANSCSSSPAKDMVERRWKRGSADRKNNVLNALRFKKQPSRTVVHPTKRPFTPVSYQSPSSSSAYPRSTSPEHFSHVCNGATIKGYGVVNADRPDPSTAPRASNNHNHPLQPAMSGADGLDNNLMEPLRDELSQLKDEMKHLRQNQHLQTPSSSIHQLAQLLQPSAPFGLSQPILDMILGLAAAVQRASAPGTSFSTPPPGPYWSQESQVPLPYAEQQQFHRLPAPAWQEHEYYPPTSPPWEHREREPSGRGRYHEVARPDAAPIPGFRSVPEDCSRHPGPWRETGYDGGRIYPVIYERGTDAGAGKYGPHQRSARGVMRERRSSARQPVKYAGPYNRPPADQGWGRSQSGMPNVHVIGHRIRSRENPSSSTVTFASNDRGTEQNRDHLHTISSQRCTPPRFTSPLSSTDGPLPAPLPALPVGHGSGSGEMFSSNHLTVQTFFQPVLIPHESQTSSEATNNVRSRPRTPVSALEQSGDGARDQPVGPQIPPAARPTSSMDPATENWEDNYEQEEATVPQNVDSKEPSRLLRTRRVQSLTYDDVTVNPWW